MGFSGMTVVVADTSPINYLILIVETEILPRLSQRIVIPGEVFAELIDDGAPPEVRGWTKQHPPWVEIKSASRRDAVLMELDEGEAAGIALPKPKRKPAFCSSLMRRQAGGRLCEGASRIPGRLASCAEPQSSASRRRRRTSSTPAT